MDFLHLVSILSDIVGIIGLPVAIFEIRKSIKERREDSLHDRRQATLDAYKSLQEDALDTLYSEYSPTAARQLYADRNNPECREEYRRFRTSVARIEHFCAGVELKIYDADTVYSLAHGFLDVAIKSRIAPILEEKDHKTGKYYYSNTRSLMAKMEKRYSEEIDQFQKQKDQE